MSAGCRCTPRRRRWIEVTGTCAACGLRVHESPIMDAVRAVLVGDPRCVLWRNQIGYYVDGDARIRYGVANPGGADLIGFFGPRFLAVEVKTIRGKQSPPQVQFGRVLAAHGCVYALARSESDARDLLEWLRSDNNAPMPEHLRGET